MKAKELRPLKIICPYCGSTDRFQWRNTWGNMDHPMYSEYSTEYSEILFCWRCFREFEINVRIYRSRKSGEILYRRIYRIGLDQLEQEEEENGT
jgi:hypothetical protein